MPPYPLRPYPPAAYDGDGGLVNAALRRADQEPELRFADGGSAHYLATGDTTDNRFGLYRWEMAAGPAGPGPHFHRGISESFLVLAGTVSLYDGKDWVDAHPGDFLHVPEGGVHGFRNTSGAPASMLLMFAPGAPREHYFETLARVGEGLTLTEQERAEFFVRHDTYWV